MTAADIRAQQEEKFRQINGLTEEEADQLSDYCLGRSDRNPLETR